MDHKVFISYSSRDVRLTERIYDRLERDGIKCWMSSRDVPPGADFQACIVAAIAQAELVLLIFSSEANNSGEIAKELSLASKKLLIPTRIEDVLPQGAFAYQLSNRQFVDLFEDFEHRLDQLSKLVQAALDGKPAPVMVSSPKKQPHSASALPKFAIPLAVAGLVGVAGIGWYLAKPSGEVTTVETAVASAPSAPSALSVASAPSAPSAAAAPSSPSAAIDSGSMTRVPPASDLADPTPMADFARTTSAPPAAQAPNPSFSCRKATHVTEKLICQSRTLADLDRALEASYKRALGEAKSARGRAAVKRNQYIWLVTTRNSCVDERCIQDAYQMRISALAELAGQLEGEAADTSPSVPQASATPSASGQRSAANSGSGRYVIVRLASLDSKRRRQTLGS